jgi:Flp pilus assembly protein TadB
MIERDSQPDLQIEAEVATVKKIFGGELSTDEAKLVSDFGNTRAGQQYLERTETMKGHLSRFAEVRPKVMDRDQMIARFEDLTREHARQAQRRFPLGVVLTSGIWAALGILLIMSDTGLKLAGGCFVALAIAWIPVLVLLRRHNERILADEDLFETLEQDRERARGLGFKLLSAGGVLLIAVAFDAFMSEAFGWPLGTGAVGVVALTVAIGAWIRRSMFARQRELESWWNGVGA